MANILCLLVSPQKCEMSSLEKQHLCTTEYIRILTGHRGEENTDQNTAKYIAPEADPDNQKNSPGILPVKCTASDTTPQKWW